jgi:hypothetical protein
MLQLKIEFKDCCDEASTPSGIYKIVRAKNRYEPLHFAKLAPPDGIRPIRTVSVAGQHARATYSIWEPHFFHFLFAQ